MQGKACYGECCRELSIGKLGLPMATPTTEIWVYFEVASQPSAWVLQIHDFSVSSLAKGRLRTSHGKHSFSHGSYSPELYVGPQML